MPGVIEAASELHRRAVDASCVGNVKEALRLARRGMTVLDSAPPADGGPAAEWLRVRIRLACLQTMETLDETAVEALRPLIANLPDPFVRAELNGFVDHDHGMMLASGGRFAESVSFSRRPSRTRNRASPAPTTLACWSSR
ncbi:hypothetical protein GCM10029964_017340 [Kibdelosporangium lantanae]